MYDRELNINTDGQIYTLLKFSPEHGFEPDLHLNYPLKFGHISVSYQEAYIFWSNMRGTVLGIFNVQRKTPPAVHHKQTLKHALFLYHIDYHYLQFSKRWEKINYCSMKKITSTLTSIFARKQKLQNLSISGNLSMYFQMLSSENILQFQWCKVQLSAR